MSRGLRRVGNCCFQLLRNTNCGFYRTCQAHFSQSLIGNNSRRVRLKFDWRSLLILSRIVLDRSLRSRSNGDGWRKLSLAWFSGGKESEQSANRGASGNLQSRGDRNGNGDNKRPLNLMEFRKLIWPHPVKWMRNFIFTALIRGYFDEHFSMGSFLDGAEQAISVVASVISKGQFDELEGLVSSEAISEVRRSYYGLSTDQRQFLAVNPKDFIFRFIYEIGMIFDDDTNQRFVEITTIFQGLHGLDYMKQSAGNYFEEIIKLQDQIYVCNYRFIREYTKGKKDDWTINKLNHFCPLEQDNDRQ